METRLKWRFNLHHASDRMLHADDRCLALVNAETKDDYFSLISTTHPGDATGIERCNRAIDPTTKTWITVGPDGTEISTNDGKNCRPQTSGYDPPDADKTGTPSPSPSSSAPTAASTSSMQRHWHHDGA
jgi:hypothetical protein